MDNDRTRAARSEDQPGSAAPQVFGSVDAFKEHYAQVIGETAPTSGADVLLLGSRAVIWFEALPGEFHVESSSRILTRADFAFLLKARFTGQVRPLDSLAHFAVKEVRGHPVRLFFLILGSLGFGWVLAYFGGADATREVAVALLIIVAAQASIAALLANTLTTSLPTLDPWVIATPWFYAANRTDRNILLTASIGFGAALSAFSLALLAPTPAPAECLPLAWQVTLAAPTSAAVFIAVWLATSVFPFYGERNIALLQPRGVERITELRRTR